jgi:translation initiation factor 2 beta subunit (eIF-2beta)/eIF-5
VLDEMTEQEGTQQTKEDDVPEFNKGHSTVPNEKMDNEFATGSLNSRESQNRSLVERQRDALRHSQDIVGTLKTVKSDPTEALEDGTSMETVTSSTGGSAISPTREEKIRQAVSFLTNDKVKDAQDDRKISFLKKKGLSDAEIQEAFTRAKVEVKGEKEEQSLTKSDWVSTQREPQVRYTM